MSERKRPAPFSCNCGRRWDGYDQAHCASCHRHFGSVNGFDLHRVGPDGDRHCADPASLLWGPNSKRSGQQRLKAVEGPHGATWVVDDPRPHPMARAGAPGVAIGNQEPAWRPLDAPSPFPATAGRPSRCPDAEVADPGPLW